MFKLLHVSYQWGRGDVTLVVLWTGTYNRLIRSDSGIHSVSCLDIEQPENKQIFVSIFVSLCLHTLHLAGTLNSQKNKKKNKKTQQQQQQQQTNKQAKTKQTSKQTNKKQTNKPTTNICFACLPSLLISTLHTLLGR